MMKKKLKRLQHIVHFFFFWEWQHSYPNGNAKHRRRARTTRATKQDPTRAVTRFSPIVDG